MRQRRFARSRRPHQRDKLAFLHVQVRVLQCDDVELVAHEFFRKITSLNNGLAHFGFTRSPSCKSAGGFTIRSSPPISPSSTRTPVPLFAPVRTVRFTARP